MLRFILYLTMSTGGMALFKLGSQEFSMGVTKSAFNLNLSYISLLGMGFYTASFLLWLFILKEADLSVIFPILSALAIVLTALIGIFLFGEKVTTMKIIGILIVMIGVFCVNGGR